MIGQDLLEGNTSQKLRQLNPSDVPWQAHPQTNIIIFIEETLARLFRTLEMQVLFCLKQTL